MNSTPTTEQLRTLLDQAVAASLEHVHAGGLPFVGQVVARGGAMSGLGVNRVRETGDPRAHAEVEALRQFAATNGAQALDGATLLATGEPCGMCYQYAADQGIATVLYAADRFDAARMGFDYLASYQRLDQRAHSLADQARRLAAPNALAPFTTFLDHAHQRPISLQEQ